MKPTIERVLILSTTCCAHHKISHRGVLPVVRTVFNNCEARPAIRAVYKRISMAAIVLVEQFLQAVAASRDVRRNWQEFLSFRRALKDKKVGVVHRVQIVATFDRLDE